MKKTRLAAAMLLLAMTAGGAASAAEAKILYPAKQYSGLGGYHDGLAGVSYKKGDRYVSGYIDRQGKEVIPCQYERVDDFADGLARVWAAGTQKGDYRADKRYGYVDTSGRSVVPMTCEGTDLFNIAGDGSFHDGLAVVNGKGYGERVTVDRNGKWGFEIGSTGRAVVNGVELTGMLADGCNDDYIASDGLGGGYYSFRIDQRFSAAEGRWIDMTHLPMYRRTVDKWVDAESSRPVFYGDANGNRWFYHLDEQPFYAIGSRVIDGMVLVQEPGGKYGVATLEERLVIPCEYDAIRWVGQTAHNAVFAARKDGVWMGIDRDGINRMPFLAQYDKAFEVIISPEGYVLVRQHSDNVSFSNNTVLDYDGNVLVPTWQGNVQEAGPFIWAKLASRNGDEWTVTECFYNAQGKRMTLGEGWEYAMYSNDRFDEEWEMGLLAFVNWNTNQAAFVDPTGAVVIPPVGFQRGQGFEARMLPAGFPSEGRIAFTDANGKRGYLAHPDWTDRQASPSTCAVTVDGVPVSIGAYEIGGSNYFKLRDLAMALKDTPAGFSVAWDARGPLRIKTAASYAPVGGELSGVGAAQAAKLSSSSIYCNGDHTNTLGYTIGDHNYYKLRDIAKLLNIRVTFDAAANTVAIDTSSRYTA